MKFFNSGEWKTLWPFYLYHLIIGSFFMIMPFFVIFFNTVGLTYKQISMLFAILFISPTIFEIPTGAFADAYGRKFSVIAGDFFFGWALFLIPLIKNYSSLVLLFLLWGLSSSFTSGADSAWVIDLLKHKKQNKLTHNYFVKIRSVASFGAIISGILGSILVKSYGLNIVWYISGVAIMFSTIFLWFFSEEYFKRKKHTFKDLTKETFNNFKVSIPYGLKHPVLLYLILGGFFVMLSAMGDVAWQPYFKDVGIPVYFFGYIFSGAALIVIGLPFLAKPLLKKFKKEKYYLSALTIFYAIVLLSVYFIFSPILAVVAFILTSFPFELKGPVEETYFQKFIPNKIRASVGSVKSMILRIGGGISLLIGGYLADLVGPRMVIVYSGFFILPGIIFYLMIKENK